MKGPTVVIGVPKEIKRDEHRVALTPAGARALVDAGHDVLVETGAGGGSAFCDEDYVAQGAHIAGDAASVFARAELIVKVKEPQPAEVGMLAPHHTLFTYLHLAAAPALARSLLDSGATCIAYETVLGDDGRLPLLAPMSEVAGRIAAQAGAYMLAKPLGGSGVLLGGVPGVPPACALVIGGGVVGLHAARVASGLGANVFVLDNDLGRLRELESLLRDRCATVYASRLTLEELLPQADLVIGAVLVAGSRAPHILVRDDLRLLKRNSVLVDVAIDQGGCFETSHATTHTEPTYAVDGVTHYCVANMPGAVPVTATRALTNATLPYIAKLAAEGTEAALVADAGFRSGLNVCRGRITHRPVALEQDLPFAPAEQALKAQAVA